MIISEESEIFEEETENENSKRASIAEIDEKQSPPKTQINFPPEANFNIFQILSLSTATPANEPLLKLSEQFSTPFDLASSSSKKASKGSPECKDQGSPSQLYLSDQEKQLLLFPMQIQGNEENAELEEQKRLLLESQNELYQLLFDQENAIKQEEEVCCPVVPPGRKSLKFFSFADQLPKPEDEESNYNNNNQIQDVEQLEEQKESVKQSKQEFIADDSELLRQQLKISDLEASEETNEGMKTKKSEESLHNNDIFGQSSQNLLEHSRNYEILTLSDCNSLVTKKCFSLFLSNQENSILEEQENILEQSQNKKMLQLKVYNENNQKSKNKQKNNNNNNSKFINNQNLKLKCKLSLLPLVQKQKQQIEQTTYRQMQLYSIKNDSIQLETNLEKSNSFHQAKKEENFQQKLQEFAPNQKQKQQQQQQISKKSKQNNFQSLKCMPKNYINFIESSIKHYDQKKIKNKVLSNQSEIIFESSSQNENKLKLKKQQQQLQQGFENKENSRSINIIYNKKQIKINSNKQSSQN